MIFAPKRNTKRLQVSFLWFFLVSDGRGLDMPRIGKAIEIVNLLGMDLCMEKRGK